MDETNKRWEHWEDLPEATEKEILEKMAKFFIGNNLGLVAQILLESGEPITKIFATLGMGLFGPYLEFVGADTYVSYFRKDGNARLLLERVEELEHNMKKLEKEPKTENIEKE